ncbi:MAG: hypothetical protein GC178_00865 [Flavobacteriales bacterium]|nr:hypothetical protein [Flavobacteriales bacterium]
MEFKVTVCTVFDCPLERAFRTPMLCDVTKVHTGFGLMPKVTHTTDDADWGKVGASKAIHVAPSLTQKGGVGSTDTVLERVENEYWKIEVGNFTSWMLGFTRFVGEWSTTAIDTDTTAITYTYTLHSNAPLLYPFNWLFANTFWRIYMRHVLENVRKMAYAQEPYLYE